MKHINSLENPIIRYHCKPINRAKLIGKLKTFYKIVFTASENSICLSQQNLTNWSKFIDETMIAMLCFLSDSKNAKDTPNLYICCDRVKDIFTQNATYAINRLRNVGYIMSEMVTFLNSTSFMRSGNFSKQAITEVKYLNYTECALLYPVMALLKQIIMQKINE